VQRDSRHLLPDLGDLIIARTENSKRLMKVVTDFGRDDNQVNPKEQMAKFFDDCWLDIKLWPSTLRKREGEERDTPFLDTRLLICTLFALVVLLTR